MSIIVNEIRVSDVYGNLLTDPVLVDNFSIGKAVIVSIDCEIPPGYSIDLQDAEFFVSPALFGDPGALHPQFGSEPTKAWVYDSNSDFTGLSLHGMTLQGCGINTQRNINSFWAIKEVGDSQKFTLVAAFEMTCDIADFITGYAIDNAHRRLKNNFYNPVAPVSGPTSNTFPSVYNQEKELIFYIFVRLGDDSTMYDYVRIPWKSRFFKKNLLNAPAELSMSYELTRDAVVVNNLSAYDPTKVKLLAKMNGEVVTEIEAVIFRYDDVDNIQPFITDLETSRQFSNNVGGKFIAPATALNIVGDDVDATWTIDPTQLDFNGKYYIMGIFYFDGGTKTNTVITPLLTANDFPNPCPLSITGRIKDYVRENTDKVITVVQDRLELELDIDPTSFNACVTANGYPIGTFASMATLINVYVKRESDGEIIFFGQHAISVNIGIDNMNAYYDGDILKIRWKFRNEYENFQSIDTWGGEQINIEYYIQLYPTVPEWDAIVYKYTQNLFVLDYDNYRTGLEVIESIELFNAADGMPLTNVCDADNILVKVKIADAHADEDWNLLAFIDTYPYGITIFNDMGLKEEESFASPQGLPAFSVVQLFDVDIQTFAGVAFFKVPTSALTQYVNYRISAIVKQIESQCDAPDEMNASMKSFTPAFPGVTIEIIPAGINAPFTVWYTRKQVVGDAWPIEVVTGTISNTAAPGNSIDFPLPWDPDLHENVVVKVDWTPADCPGTVYEIYFIFEYNNISGEFDLYDTITVEPNQGAEVDNWSDRTIVAGGTLSSDDLRSGWTFLKFAESCRAKLQRVNILTGSDMAAVMTPLLFNSDASITPIGLDLDTNNGWLISDYSRDTGLKDHANTGKYIESGYDVTEMVKEDNAFSVYVNREAVYLSNDRADINVSSGHYYIRARTSAPNLYFSHKNANPVATGQFVGSSLGHFLSNRFDSAQHEKYLLGRMFEGNISAASVAPSGTLDIGKDGANYSQRDVLGYHVGTSMTADEIKMLYLAFTFAFKKLARW